MTQKSIARLLSFAVMCVLVVSQAVAQGTETISLKLKNATLHQFFQKIEAQTDYKCSYRDVTISKKNDVTIEAKSISVAAALDQVLTPRNLAYSFPTDKSIVIFGKTVQQTKTRTITGVIKDENGEPVIGANVLQKGTSNGTITDFDGRYTLQVPAGAEVQVSYLGFTTQSFIAKAGTGNVTLRESAQALNEVVVVGYSTRKVEDITGAVSNIRADKTNIGGASTSVDQMLSGRIAGVQIKQNSSQPGGGGQTLIRGRNSLFLNTSPLYVVDGFVVNTPSTPSNGSAFSSPDRNPLNSINPNDIESVAVLKDAAATAIYGSQGSNGVIIITTKRGKQGKLKVSYSGYASFQEVGNKYDVMDAQDYMEMNNWLGRTNFSEQEIKNAKTTDWFDEVTQTGFIQSHDLSMSGGTEALKYYFSIGMYGMDGIVKNTGMDRYTGRSNISYSKDGFTFKSTMFATHIVDENQPTQGGTRNSVISSAMAYAPNLAVYNQDGSYTKDPNNDFIANPVSLLDIKDKTYTDKLNFSASAAYELTPNLKPEVKMSYDTQNALRKLYVPTTTAYNGSFSHNGTASQSEMRSTGLTFDGLLHYNFQIGEDHKFNGMVGYEYQKKTNNYFRSENSGFGTDATGANNLAAGNAPQTYSSRDERIDISGFGRMDYSYQDKYLATATVRRDGSSVFGANEKYAYFPGVSFGWKIDKEDFMEKYSGTIDLLKLRLGWGQSGNSGIAPYQSLGKYDMVANGVIGNNNLVGAKHTDYEANPDLKWETTSQLNLGLDFGFLGRLSGNLDFFVKQTEDMLVNVAQSPLSGYGYKWENAAEMAVWGMEFALNSTNIQTEDFSWNTQFSFSWNDNEITGYNTTSESTINSLNANGIIDGERTNTYYTYKVDGVDPETGSWTYVDINNDGKVDLDDRTMLGSPDPKVIMGLGNTFNYKGWSLNVFFNSNFGNKMFNQMAAESTLPKPSETLNYLQDANNHWTAGAVNASIPGNRAMPQGNVYYNSHWIEDAWFIRLQNVTLSYDLSRIPAVKRYLDKAKVYVQGQNLFLITPYDGLDPELSNTSATGVSEYYPAFLPGSVDMNAYPPSRTYTIGVNFSF